MKGITFEKMDGSALKVGIVVARWNSVLTYSLRDGAIQGLKDSGVLDDNIVVLEVPGSYEVVFGAKHLIETKKVDAVICLGVLVKGETMHFEYISDAVTQGIMDLNTTTGIPVIYGVLNCLTEQQAEARATGDNNHGYWWGKSAVEMALLA
ncbi:MAG: 6,7-dimethyl-8-ribityllumazine synthase [Candidatus Magasanikbacteria bacterium CG10_big_fil_rev_8_21_14_0_10_47_10]|uniref:6,7-dimethyl-8-ribityllumazine synthase n=1 Tax=Candidatus Magasanikbacteria bacterium CG10_big_fil_rev_8_21_14_0_10_47_10 TaxID=1974652 RepID=A0A2H0TRG4_9BACT|nr:MAG: 6,7-dimethyl-8-ribityllumazine synthase [Candidatus Magasanikbacteria bacterium CG10_big_fil_rev_8_21_14_0_10_47_10]